ncbi:MAG: hypothetical protein HGA65_17220, partial [Oscillochloris sp.]|nr:hypothetical protein [Oscillochloris sp.]
DLHQIEERMERNRREFLNQIGSTPCCALRIMESIATDRVRHLHLAMLSRGLSTDYDRWVQATMDQRMEQVGFQRLASHHPLYLRKTYPGVDLSDLFSVIHIDQSDIHTLIAKLHQK